MSENSFEKIKTETPLEQEIKDIEEKYEKLLKEEIKQTNSEFVEKAFELFGDDPEKLKEAIYLVVNKTSNELIEGHFQTIREYKNKSESSTSPESFFEEIPSTLH